MWVFDLDGTLVDTRLAVLDAYGRAGVNMPEDAWGLPWQDWLITPEGRPDFAKHALKNAAYPDCVARLARRLDLLEFAVSNRCPILTGASRPAVETIEACFGVTLNVRGYSMTVTDKVFWLRGVTAVGKKTLEDEGPTNVYVDDDTYARGVIRASTDWRVLCPKHAYRLLSSPPAPTLD